MKTILEAIMKGFIENYPGKNNTITKWKEPIIAYADAKDKLFEQLKKVVSPTHALPEDLVEDAKTVIAYFIPFDESIAKSNIEGRISSKLWAEAYIETNKLIADLNAFINIELNNLGFNCSIIPATHNFDEDKLISDWSHRHVAFIAGLGKFGLNNMLITEKGCCGRVGSIVTNLKVEPSPMTSKEYCLYKYNGSCKRCATRCVNDALKVECFNRHKCYEMCLINDDFHSDLGLTDVCGKCVVGVPCSMMNPVKG